MTTTTAPSWLDSSLVEKILRKSENDESINVLAIDQKPVVADGDNYCSRLIRVKAEFTRGSRESDERSTGNQSLLFKIELTDSARASMFTNIGLFEKEAEMLSNILVSLNRLWRPDSPLSPKLIEWHPEPPTYMVIEDLTPLGFRMTERNSGLDLAESLLAIRNLARFHACSVALKEQNPKVFDKFDKYIFDTDLPESLKEFHESMIKSLGIEIANWTELDPRYSEKMIKLAESVWERARIATLAREDEFNVLNHGDCWSNNMLFRYDDQGKPVDHIFVDFQIPLWSSPAVDLVYFLVTNVSRDVKFRKEEQILEEYQKTLDDIMKRLGCRTKAPTIDELRKAIGERVALAAIGAFAHVPFTLTDDDSANDLDLVLESKSETENGFTWSSAYRKILPDLISTYEKLGLFDECVNSG